MATMTQITVQDGMRWDTVSYKAYGNATMYKSIIEANPDIPITPTIPGGTVLNIPILENNSVKIDAELLPPWKR